MKVNIQMNDCQHTFMFYNIKTNTLDCFCGHSMPLPVPKFDVNKFKTTIKPTNADYKKFVIVLNKDGTYTYYRRKHEPVDKR